MHCDGDRLLLPTLRVGHAEGVVRLPPEAEEVPSEPGVEEGPEVLLLPCKPRNREGKELEGQLLLLFHFLAVSIVKLLPSTKHYLTGGCVSWSRA